MLRSGAGKKDLSFAKAAAYAVALFVALQLLEPLNFIFGTVGREVQKELSLPDFSSGGNLVPDLFLSIGRLPAGLLLTLFICSCGIALFTSKSVWCFSPLPRRLSEKKYAPAANGSAFKTVGSYTAIIHTVIMRN